MKRFITILLILLLFSCAKNSNEVQIITSKEKVKFNEIFSAKLSVDYDERVLPDFFIIIDKDTFLLPFDKEGEYASFNAIASIKGKNKYCGFVEYFDKSGKKSKSEFKISFTVD